MQRNSEINEVHTARLGDRYSHVAAYLREPKPKGRRSYEKYVDKEKTGNPVYKLNTVERSITFQSECLLPQNDRKRPRVLLLFSNAHPESIKNGMFHTAEGRVAALWTDLCQVGLFSGDPTILESAKRLREHCRSVAYDGLFAFGLTCYWIFPTFHPNHLRRLFEPNMEPSGFEDPKVRLNRLLARWKPRAIISFNGQVFEALTGRNTKGYTKRLYRGTLEGKYPARGRDHPVFQTYPTGWRYHKNAPALRQASLRRIANSIQSTIGRR